MNFTAHDGKAGSGQVGDRRLAQERIDLGLAAEAAGLPADAVRLYREAIAADPEFATAHMNLGIALRFEGAFDEAIASYRQAIVLDPGSAAAHYNLGLAWLESGRFALAEVEFREALRFRSRFPEANVALADALEALERNEEALEALDAAIIQREHYAGAQFNSGMLLRKMGRVAEAEVRLKSIDLTALLSAPDRHTEIESVAKQLLNLWPDHALAWRSLGTLLALQARFDEAVPALQKALAWLATDAEVHNNLGASLDALGRPAEAETCYRRAIQLRPDYSEAHNNLGKVLANLDRHTEAEVAFRTALGVNPDDFDAHSNLGNTLRLLGRFSEAEQCFRNALAIEPDSHLTHNNLAITLQDLGRLSEAEAHFRRALELKDDFHEAHTNLGNVLQAFRRYSEAETSYRTALSLKPDSAPTHSNLGAALRELGRVRDAESSFRRALEIDPDYPEARSNLLFTLNYADGVSRAELFDAHVAWARQHEAPLRASRTYRTNNNDSLRPLRIGYVSPDFRRHSVAYFIEPVLARHERREFQVYCYSNVLNPDRITERLLGMAVRAQNIVGMSDARAAELVRADEIDILVDLAGHTGRARLGVFALKPAPLQASYLGYPNTTGLESIDWRITDVHADPRGAGDEFYSERLMRLPNTFLCFRPPEEAPEVQAPPHLESGHLTFGSFNALPKVTEQVIVTWSKLLNRVPGARLMLKAQGLSDPRGRQRLVSAFRERGIEEARLTLLGAEMDFRKHLFLYDQMDIALDPFPYNGTTTTLEALWMGVPVVTLAGDRHGGRVGVSILTNLDLGPLIARSAEEYLEIAIALATDLPRLASLRRTMRKRISASPLRDEAGFVHALETAYREMWRLWCKK